MAESFKSVHKRAAEAAGSADASPWLRELDPRQRKALELFRESDTITSRDVEALFTISQRTARLLLKQWADAGFLAIVDPSKKGRKYALAQPPRELSSRC